MLVVENVSHGFGARTILENVSFRLRKGEHIALVGANGEGKSTFLNIITKKLIPAQGKSSEMGQRFSVIEGENDHIQNRCIEENDQ